jgi:hypothetical protein
MARERFCPPTGLKSTAFRSGPTRVSSIEACIAAIRKRPPDQLRLRRPEWRTGDAERVANP